MTARDWGEENPGLTKRYVARIARAADGDISSNRDIARTVGKTVGLIAAPPVALAATAIGACELVHVAVPAISQQFSAVVGDAGFTGLMGLEVSLAGVMLLSTIGDPSDEVVSRRLRGALRITQTSGIVATTASGLLAAALDTGDAMHLFNATGAAHNANGALGVAAGATGLAIVGTKLYKAIAKPLPAKALSE